MVLLELADRFEMLEVKRRCEECLMSRKPSVNLLVSAQTYNLQRVLNKCVVVLKNRSFRDLQREKEFRKINEENMVKLYGEKIKHLELRTSQAQQKEKIQQGKFEELQQMFTEIKAVTAGPFADRKKDEIIRRVDKAMDVLRLAASDTIRTMSPVKSSDPTWVVNEGESNSSSRQHDFDEYEDLDNVSSAHSDSAVDASSKADIVREKSHVNTARSTDNSPTRYGKNETLIPISAISSRGRSLSTSESESESESDSQSGTPRDVHSPSEDTNKESGYGTHSPQSTLNISETKTPFQWDGELAIPNVEGGISLGSSSESSDNEENEDVKMSALQTKITINKENSHKKSGSKRFPSTPQTLEDSSDFFDNNDQEDLGNRSTWGGFEKIPELKVNDQANSTEIDDPVVGDEFGFATPRELNIIKEEDNDTNIIGDVESGIQRDYFDDRDNAGETELSEHFKLDQAKYSHTNNNYKIADDVHDDVADRNVTNLYTTMNKEPFEKEIHSRSNTSMGNDKRKNTFSKLNEQEDITDIFKTQQEANDKHETNVIELSHTQYSLEETQKLFRNEVSDIKTNVTEKDNDLLENVAEKKEDFGTIQKFPSELFDGEANGVENEDWLLQFNTNGKQEVHNKVTNWNTGSNKSNIDDIFTKTGRNSVAVTHRNTPSRQSRLQMTSPKATAPTHHLFDNSQNPQSSRSFQFDTPSRADDMSSTLPTLPAAHRSSVPDWLSDLKGDKKRPQSRSTDDIPFWLKDTNNSRALNEEDMESLKSEFSFGKGNRPASENRLDSGKLFPPLNYNQKTTGMPTSDILERTF